MARLVNEMNAISQPKLSIMVPAFGESPFLSQTLQSLLENTTTDITNIYVVDDASATEHIKNICTPHVDRINYIRNDRNLGLAGNFQNCINLSKTEYTMIMGSDDRVLRGIEESFLSSFEKWPGTALLQLGVRAISESGEQVRGLTERVKSIISPARNHDLSMSGINIIHRILVGQFLYFPAIVWRSESLKKYNLDLNYKTAVDLDLILKMALNNEVFTFVTTPTFEYRRHDASISSQLKQNTIRVDEEFSVHEAFLRNSNAKGYSQFEFLAKLALTIRLNALKSGILLLLKGSPSGAHLIYRSLKPIQAIK